MSTLQEGLTDIQNHSSSGACVVLNSTIRIRGHELKKEVRINSSYVSILQLCFGNQLKADQNDFDHEGD